MIGRVNLQVFIFTRNPKFMVLILKRIPERDSYWQPISGGFEEDEKPIDAIKREIYEETGIKELERIIDLKCSFIFKTLWYGKLTKMREIYFTTEIKKEKPIRISNEHEEYKWYTEDKAKIFLKWKHNIIALNKLINLIKLEYEE